MKIASRENTMLFTKWLRAIYTFLCPKEIVDLNGIIPVCFTLPFFNYTDLFQPVWTPGAQQSHSAVQRRENIMKGSEVKIRTGRHPSSVTIIGKTDSTWE